MNAYMLFSEQRASFKEANPDASVGELSKLMGEQWKEMNEEAKKPYNDKAESLKAEYDEAMKVFYEAHPELAKKPKAPSKPREPGAAKSGGGGGGNAALMGVIAELKEVKEKKAELEEEIAGKRKLLAKCAAKREKLAANPSAEGADDLKKKIDEYEAQINGDMSRYSRMGRLKEKRKGLVVRYDEINAAEEAKKEAAAAKSAAKRKERDAEKAAEKEANERAEAEAKAAKRAKKEREREEASNGGSLTHLLLEDPKEAKPDKAGSKRAAEADDEQPAAEAASPADGGAGRAP